MVSKYEQKLDKYICISTDIIDGEKVNIDHTLSDEDKSDSQQLHSFLYLQSVSAVS